MVTRPRQDTTGHATEGETKPMLRRRRLLSSSEKAFTERVLEKKHLYRDKDEAKPLEISPYSALDPWAPKTKSIVPEGIQKNPLYPNKDDAERPYFDREQYYKSNSNNAVPPPDLIAGQDGRPPSISYFPDQVTQISFLVSVSEEGQNSFYLQDLEKGIDILATSIATSKSNNYFQGMWIREVTTSMDGWFPAACPENTNLSNCQDVTSSIGVYLTPIGNDFDIDPSTMANELNDFRSSIIQAIENNKLQETIETFYPNSEPPVYVIPSDTSIIGGDTTTVGEGDGDDNQDSDIVGSNTGDNNLDNLDNSATDNILPGSDGSGNDFVLPADPSIDVGGDSDIPISDPSAGHVSSRESALSTGGIVGIVLVSLAAVLIIVGLLQIRRLSKANRQVDGNGRTRRSKKGDNDMMSDHDDKETNCKSDEFLPDISNDDRSIGLNQTAPTVSASTSSMSVVSSSSSFSAASSAAANPQRRRQEAWKKDEISVPVHTSRCLSPFQEADEEKKDDQDEMGDEAGAGRDEMDLDPVVTIDSDLNLYQTGSSEIVQTGSRMNTNGKERDDASGSAGSSGWSSNASRSSAESPLHSMTARSIAALQKQQKVTSTTRGISRSQRELEDVLASGTFDNIVNEEEELIVVGHVPATGESQDVEHDADDETSPQKFHKLSKDKDIDSPSPPLTKRSNSGFKEGHPLSHLDEAIMNGDWAAVGATAALMVASISPEDKAKKNTRREWLSSPPPEKAELDQLIEAGDWEAVMLAAARYDSEGGTSSLEDGSRSARSRSSTQGSDTADGSYSSAMDHSSANHTSRGSVETDGSQKERVLEIRAQVEQMVRDVVPDELQNIDEMMAQFKGKEEELLETLRTMKERDVAKKARLESNRIVKRTIKDKKGDLPLADLNEGTIMSPPRIVTSSRNLSEELPSVSSALSDNSDSHTSDDGTAGSTDIPMANGSFEQAAANVDADSAAAAAAAWAIERSLSELMEKEQAATP